MPDECRGVYCPWDMSLKDFIYTYVGGPDCAKSNGKTCANGETGASVQHYLDETVARLNRYYGIADAPAPDTSALTFGRVPKPAWTDRLIPNSANSAWDDLGPRSVLGVTYHRMVGTLWGTDSWFRGGGGASGLTDFGLDAQSGETLRWNDERGRRAGWASGRWQHGSATGEAFVAKYGVNAINRDLTSIEVSGNYGDSISERGRAQIVALTAYLADRERVPWTSYPMNPKTGLTFAYQHHDFQNEKPCAGPVLIGLMPQIAQEVKARLKQYQEPS